MKRLAYLGCLLLSGCIGAARLDAVHLGGAPAKLAGAVKAGLTIGGLPGADRRRRVIDAQPG